MNWKALYETIKVGDKVICIKDYGSLKKGTEGIVRQIDLVNSDRGTSYAVEITKKVGNGYLHNCDGVFNNGEGWYFRSQYIKKI